MVESHFYKNHELSQTLLKSQPAHVLKAIAGHGGTQVFKTEESFSEIKTASMAVISSFSPS